MWESEVKGDTSRRMTMECATGGKGMRVETTRGSTMKEG